MRQFECRREREREKVNRNKVRNEEEKASYYTTNSDANRKTN